VIKRLLSYFFVVRGLSVEELEILRLPRSSGWRRVRNEHLLKFPNCAICGGTKNCVPHHIVPFHVDPSRELDPDNLITLCEGSFNCHLFFGHLKNWTRNNSNIVEDAKFWCDRLMGL